MLRWWAYLEKFRYLMIRVSKRVWLEPRSPKIFIVEPGAISFSSLESYYFFHAGLRHDIMLNLIQKLFIRSRWCHYLVDCFKIQQELCLRKLCFSLLLNSQFTSILSWNKSLRKTSILRKHWKTKKKYNGWETNILKDTSTLTKSLRWIVWNNFTGQNKIWTRLFILGFIM